MRYLALAAVVALAGCNYREPQAPSEPMSRAVPGASRQAIVDAAVAELAAEGYQPTADDKRGIVTTVPRRVRLTPEQVDCGTEAGIPLAKDDRTTTTVAWTVTAADGSVTASTHIDFDYLPSNPSWGKSGTAASTGVIERQAVDRIAARCPAAR